LAHIPTHIAPPPGLRFIDEQQTYWYVESVVHDSKSTDFFLVRLRHGKTEACEEGTRVLAPSEYATLARERGFRAIAPDIAHPVPAMPAARG
jgi:hypothetical protein